VVFMKTRIIEVDTTGDNADKFTNNLELYDLMVPDILMLVDDCRDIVFTDEVDWVQTRKFFEPNNNGHYIWTNAGCISSCDIKKIIIKVSEDFYGETLSELCDELAKANQIENWINSRSK